MILSVERWSPRGDRVWTCYQNGGQRSWFSGSYEGRAIRLLSGGTRLLVFYVGHTLSVHFYPFFPQYR